MSWKCLLTHPAVLAALIGTPPLVLLSFISHSLYAGGANLAVGLWATGFALAMSWILGRKEALPFLNSSSLQTAYAARLARAYLGASNFFRYANDEGRDVTSVDPDDDVWLNAYRPESAGGPLHLINVCLNETVDHFSQRLVRDRHGQNLAVGPAGLSIGVGWHATWERPPGPRHEGGVARATDPEDLPHPLRGPEAGSVKTQPLQLSDWIAISGAAISPGRGQGASLGMSLLFGLANLRTGYWWNSGLDEAQRPGLPRRSIPNAVLRLPLHIFRTQCLILDEFTSAFKGPWRRFWYLSDGGFFDNCGLYELIRRRVPYIVASDASQDGLGKLEDLAGIIRKARIDFDAEIRFLTVTEIEALEIPEQVKSALGGIDDLRPGEGNRSRKHASLALIYYSGATTPAGVLLYIKSTLTGDEPVDVLNYQAEHLQFPHDPTSDQFFDEAQWESYRRLGEHILSPLLAEGFWLPKVLNSPRAAP